MYRKMGLVTLVASVLFIIVATNAVEVDNIHLRCLVCRKIVEKMEDSLSKIDPKRTIDVGSYRLDAVGNEIKKNVPLRYSETYISEVLENICPKDLKDYVRAVRKDTKELILMNLLGPNGMNPEISKVDIVQDDDLNKSVEFLCADVISHEEENFIEYFKKETDRQDDVCADVCQESEERDEL